MIGTTAELKSKTWIKFIDLFYGSMLPSGNDAAFLLSEIVGYLNKLDGNKKSVLKNIKYLDISN
jgi:D-alanyl-D-alanine carboxypeptidase